jgi:large subunit ribosomal protein L30
VAKLKITQTRSIIKCKDYQIATLKALGLKKIGSVVVHEDNDGIRGMINVVSHLVKVEEIEG